MQEHALDANVEVLTALEEFDFGGNGFQQVLVNNKNVADPDVLIEGKNGKQFIVEGGVSFNLSTNTGKAISGLTIKTQASGNCQMIWF
jgi:hypothetical protein